jgi:hypothetical protein
LRKKDLKRFPKKSEPVNRRRLLKKAGLAKATREATSLSANIATESTPFKALKNVQSAAATPKLSQNVWTNSRPRWRNTSKRRRKR